MYFTTETLKQNGYSRYTASVIVRNLVRYLAHETEQIETLTKRGHTMLVFNTLFKVDDIIKYHQKKLEKNNKCINRQRALHILSIAKKLKRKNNV